MDSGVQPDYNGSNDKSRGNSITSLLYNLSNLLGAIGALVVGALGIFHQPILCLWLLVDWIIYKLPIVWRSWLIPVLWLSGSLVDLFTGSSLGIGGCFLLLQTFVAKVILKKYPRICLAWFIISALIWVWWLQPEIMGLKAQV